METRVNSTISLICFKSLSLLLIFLGIISAFQPTHSKNGNIYYEASSVNNGKFNRNVHRYLHGSNHSSDANLSPSCTSSVSISRRSTLIASFLLIAKSLQPKEANAAPPIAIISEELGYFPVTDSKGRTIFIPARVKRKSTDQAIALAKHLSQSGAVMYGAYWCPHCSRQKEIFGGEAWSHIKYVECSPKGYEYGGAKMCAPALENGFPTWKFSKEKFVSGEMPLGRIAELSAYKGSFDSSLETPLPSSMGNAAACS